MGMAENIEKIRKKKGFTRAQIEATTGIKNLYQKEKGLRSITEKDIDKLSKALGCQKSDIVANSENYKNIPENIRLVNVYDLRYIENMDLNDINNVVMTVAIDLDFLENTIGSKNIILVKYHSNSMYPFLQYEDILYIDTNCNKFINNALFLIKENNSLVIRRVVKKELHKNIITLFFDNSGLTSQTAEIMEENFLDIMVGRVVYIGRSIIDN